MEQLAVGDSVQVRANTFSPVYVFSHRMGASEVRSEFVSITTSASKQITLTPNHYLYVNGALAIAGVVKVGDTLTTASGEGATVVSVSRVWSSGLFNPHTMDGDIIVDGIQASTYTADINPSLAHALLWPVRMLYSLGKADVVGDAFARGSDLIAAVLPNGEARY
jgi:hypothetical protein